MGNKPQRAIDLPVVVELPDVIAEWRLEQSKIHDWQRTQHFHLFLCFSGRRLLFFSDRRLLRWRAFHILLRRLLRHALNRLLHRLLHAFHAVDCFHRLLHRLLRDTFLHRLLHAFHAVDCFHILLQRRLHAFHAA